MKKQTFKFSNHKKFIVEKKDPKIVNYFNNVLAVDRRVNKQRMREILVKRYMENIGDRIFKYTTKTFGNYTFTIDINNYLDCIE